MINKRLVKSILTIYELAYKYYFRVKVIGIENLPCEGPALLVGNHNGAINSPDMLMFFIAWYRHQGFDKPLYGLTHEIFFNIPFVGNFIKSVGAVPATKEAAREIFNNKGFIIVYPGGDLDAYKSFFERYKINFHKRYGFIKLALSESVPIIPVVSIGGHDGLIIFSSGRELAKKLYINKIFRLNVLPFSFSIPWGFTIGPFLPYIPFPSKIRIKVGKPIKLPYSANLSEDESIIKKCYNMIEAKMQKILDELRDKK